MSVGHNSLAKDTILTFEKAIISIKKVLISMKGSETILDSTYFSFIEDSCYNEPGSCNSLPS